MTGAAADLRVGFAEAEPGLMPLDLRLAEIRYAVDQRV